MKRTSLTSLAVAAATGLALAAAMSGARAAESSSSAQGNVHSITLPTMPPELPDAPGRDVVLANCVLCHSPRYIVMQPAFSKDAWTAEVNKMRKTFGAPVAEEKVEDIVNYLVAIRGK